MGTPVLNLMNAYISLVKEGEILLNDLNQQLANYSLQAKFSSLPVFVRNSFIRTHMSVCLDIIYDCF